MLLTAGGTGGLGAEELLDEVLAAVPVPQSRNTA
jgi:hypothetical protein